MNSLVHSSLNVLATLALAATASAQALTNQDDCANSGFDVRPGSGVYNFDTTGATTGTEGQAEQQCLAFGTTNIEKDIWFTYVATVDGTVTINTCNSNGSSGDTKIAAWPGSPACPVNGTSINCSDDECGLLGAMDFPVITGQSYILQVGSFPSGGGGSGTIDVYESEHRSPLIVAHYKLDETSGTTAADSSGQGHSGTFGGGYTLGQPGADPATATSVLFNGTTGRAQVPNSPILSSLRNDLTVAAWVRPNSHSGTQRVFANSFSWGFGIQGDKIYFSMELDYLSTAVVPLDVWSHIAVVVDAGNDGTFYLNGVEANTVERGAMATPPAPSWYVGAITLTSSEFWGGELDDVQVYQGALTSDEVLTLYSDPGSIIAPSLPIGTAYCTPAFPNSTGVPAEIDATGSVLITANDVTLTASSMPPGQFGYFLAGQMQGFFNPPGSSGIICLAGNIGRYNQIANIIQGPTGSIVLDLASIPVNPPQPVLPGETWNFQCWFRDNDPSLTSNFTDGVEILFQ